MILQKNIDFKDFYIKEFFTLAQAKVVKNLPDKNATLLNKLLSNLDSESDTTNGIEKLAQERGSSELSIFLFDIIDRIGDYPPTVAHDALPDIVDDFVNAAGIMLEESETIDAVKKVNTIYEGGTKELAEEVSETVEKEEVVRVDESEPVLEEPVMPFVEFAEQYFFESLEKELKKDNELINFTKLLLNDETPSLPDNLSAMKTLLFRVIPQQEDKEFSTIEYILDIESSIKAYVKQLRQFNKDNKEIINTSLAKNSLSVFLEETATDKEFKHEEIPQEPTTIDNILSEYFLSEIEDHRNRTEKVLQLLKEKPEENQNLKKLIAEFNSFKEISMIHGYPVIENFCVQIINELQSGYQKKRSFNYDTIPIFKNIFDALKQIEQLKDPKKPTPVSKRLNSDLEGLKNTLWSVPTQAAVEVKKHGEETYGIKDKDKLLDIFIEVLKGQKKKITNYIKNEAEIGSAVSHLTNLEKTILIIDQKEFAPLFSLFIDHIKEMHDAGYDPEWAEFIASGFDQFVAEFPGQKNLDYWNKVIQYIGEEENLLSLEQPERLIEILCNLEQKNLASFDSTLQKVFSERDNNMRQAQNRHFSRMKQNLKLVGAQRSVGFADFFSTLFSNENGVDINADAQNELRESYKIFLESLAKNGLENDPTDLVQVLDEVLKGSAEKEDKIEDVDKSVSEESVAESGETGDQDEEDLNEIFRQEASNYLDAADSSLQQLQHDNADQEAVREIERGVHSLKASARLMGYDDVADMAGPLESLCEKLIGHKIANMDEVTSVLGEGLQLLRQAVNDKKIDKDSFLKKLAGLDIQVTEKIQTQEDQQKKPKSLLDEKPLFSATKEEEDEDLLDIFKEESAEFLRIIEKANEKLKTKPLDRESLGQLENASHSLKSAAKMLGFREIGQIGDAIEELVESIKNNDIIMTDMVNQRVSDSLKTIQNLTAGQKLDTHAFAELMNSMDVKRISEEQAASGEETDTSFFVQEGTDLVERINVDLLALEKSPDKHELIDNLSRNLHTLKGSSQIVGLENIGLIAHLIEDFFERIKSEKRPIADDEMDVIFQGIDEVQNLISLVRRGNRDESASLKSLIGILERKLHKKTAAGRSRQSARSEMKSVQMDHEFEHENETEQVIKVTTERLDNLINMAAELVVNKSQLTNYLEKLKEISSKIDTDKRKLKSSTEAINSFLEKLKGEETIPDKEDEFVQLSEISGDFKHVVDTFDAVVSDFKSITQNFELNLGQISSLTKLLHDDILQVRMVPTTVLFSRFPRAVRDLAKKQKKKINLVVEGETTEMDRAMVESLTDPIMHLVRNAVDHGIETPQMRKKKGKNEDGILLLRATRDKSHIIVEVQDDGNGMDPEVLKKAIVRKKMAKKSEVEKMRTDEIIQYIFKPGFTTKKGASKVSGRGVGLDVVAENIRQLKGDISINSTPDKGTIFSIRVPLTLAITQAMLIESQGEILAVPITDVEETIEIGEGDIISKNNRDYVTLRDEQIPLVEIKKFLKYEPTSEPEDLQKQYALIVKDKEVKYALLVDKVLRREEIVVKSLGEELNNLEFISGGTILGDGKVVLILDVDGISRVVGREYFGKETDFASLELARQVVSEEKIEKSKPSRKTYSIKKKNISDRSPVALIVDDALSVRKFVSSVLERNKYETKLANDGKEAVGQLESNEFDVIITDLEMPEMSGFDLIEKIRGQKKYNQIPVIILTGRAGKENKEKGIKLGANAYIVKPFKENDLLKILEEFIEVGSK
jgi:chemotaxis protein histidine kinase CheA/ActR/RegA family two-component response regulator